MLNLNEIFRNLLYFSYSCFNITLTELPRVTSLKMCRNVELYTTKIPLFICFRYKMVKMSTRTGLGYIYEFISIKFCDFKANN